MHRLRQCRVREDRSASVSASVVSSVLAMTNPWISSVTSEPIMWAPSSCAGLRIEDRLDEALVVTERDRLAVADEREPSDLHLVTRLLRGGFRQAHARDLRAAVGAAGDPLAAFIGCTRAGRFRRCARRRAHPRASPCARGRGARHVADRVHTGSPVAVHSFVTMTTAVELRPPCPRGRAPRRFRRMPMATITRSERRSSCLAALALDRRGHAPSPRSRGHHRRARVNRHPLLLELLARECGDLLVLDGRIRGSVRRR